MNRMNSTTAVIAATAIVSFATGLIFSKLLRRLASTKDAAAPPSSSDPSSDDDEDEGSSSESESEDANLVLQCDPSKWGVTSAPYKLVLCVNKELKMSPGKIAAQCCHAAVSCYKRGMKKYPAAIRAWEWTGTAKVAVKLQGKDVDEEMAGIIAECKKRGVVYYMVSEGVVVPLGWNRQERLLDRIKALSTF